MVKDEEPKKKKKKKKGGGALIQHHSMAEFSEAQSWHFRDKILNLSA